MKARVHQAHLIAASKWNIAAIGVGLFAGSLGIYMVPLQIGALIEGLGLAESRAGILGAAEVGAMSLTAIIISPFLSSWSRSRTAVLGVLFAAACELLTAFSQEMALLLPLRIAVGIGCGCAFAGACSSAASSTEPDRNFGIGQGIMNSIFFVLFLVVPYSMTYGIHRGLFLSLMLILLLTLPMYRYFINAPGSTDGEITGKASIRWSLAGLHILATILVNVGLGALWAFVERMGTQNVGLSVEEMGRVLSMATIFMVSGSLFAAWLGTRLGRAVPLALASVICAVAAVMVTRASTLELFATGLFIYNFFYLFIGPYIIAGTASALDPSGRLAAAMGGVMFFSYSVGIGTGGFIAELVSLSGIGNLALVSCLLAAPLFVFVSIRLEKTSGN